MRKTITLAAMLAMSAMLVFGLSGCITVNVQNPDNKETGSDTAQNSGSDISNTGDDTSNTSGDAKNGNSNASASSSAASANKNEGRGSSAPSATKKAGNKKTGYIEIPSDWKDRTTDDFDERMVDSTGLVYVVDPTTEYTSAVLAHYSFSSSLKLEVFPCGYTDKADEMLYDYRGRADDYSSPTIEKTTFNGHAASIVACESADGVHITHIIFDNADSGMSCVMITANSTSSTDDAVLGAAATWAAA